MQRNAHFAEIMLPKYCTVFIYIFLHAFSSPVIDLFLCCVCLKNEFISSIPFFAECDGLSCCYRNSRLLFFEGSFRVIWPNNFRLEAEVEGGGNSILHFALRFAIVSKFYCSSATTNGQRTSSEELNNRQQYNKYLVHWTYLLTQENRTFLHFQLSTLNL